MNRIAILVLTLSLSCSLALPKIPMRMPSRATIRRHSMRPSNADEKITPLFGPQVTINIGTPPQSLAFSIDTTNGDSFIVDYAASPQPNQAVWQFTTNSTSLETSSYAYNADVVDKSGYPAHISGSIADDIFVDFTGHSYRMKFALIESVSTRVQNASNVWVPDQFATGRLGFGWYASDYLDLFVPNLLASMSADKKSFGLMEKECMLDPNDEQTMGEFSLGFVDDRFCNLSTSVTAKVVDGKAWDFNIDSFDVGTLTLPFKQMATVNTGEMLTGVPQKVYDYVSKIGNATFNPQYLWPLVDCDAQYPTLDFSIAGQMMRFTDDFYIFRDYKANNQPCHLMLYPLNGGGFLPSWSFGFLSIYQKCMLFDYGKRSISFMSKNSGLCDHV